MRIVRCRACAMVYADAAPEPFASGVFYKERQLYLLPEKLRSDYAAVRFERELRLFRRWCARGAVLDVGCSTGGFLHQLATRYPEDYTVLGCDLPGPALDYAASQRVPVTREPFLEIKEKRFDAITLWAVLEHLPDPKRFLTHAGHLLKPGGLCFVLTPNLQSLAVRLLGRRYRYIMPEHLNYFILATLMAMARSLNAFEVVEYGSTHFNPVVIWQDLLTSGLSVPDAERAKLLDRTTAWKQNRWLTPLRWLYGGAEHCLGRLSLADNIFVVLQKRF
jgi:2-polyprenyl-3-methyl-5-hydroxy-6-metoxy-1,4-benzoquinol methylase